MKHLSGIIALILALLTLVSVTAACGDDKDAEKGAQTADADKATQAVTEAKTDATEAGTEAPTESHDDADVAGSEQSWGELTVFVPDSMNMQGGNGTYDPDDQKTVWLYDNDKATYYIEVRILDSEENAKSNVEMTKSVNETYHPEDISFTAGGEWTGVAYDAHGIPCTNAYAVIGDKVYFIMAAGHEYDSEVMQAVLGSLK